MIDRAMKRSVYRGVGITLERDQYDRWWAVSLGKTFGPFANEDHALDLVKDHIDTRD